MRSLLAYMRALIMPHLGPLVWSPELGALDHTTRTQTDELSDCA
jgi:hypothetical protein